MACRSGTNSPPFLYIKCRVATAASAMSRAHGEHSISLSLSLSLSHTHTHTHTHIYTHTHEHRDRTTHVRAPATSLGGSDHCFPQAQTSRCNALARCLWLCTLSHSHRKYVESSNDQSLFPAMVPDRAFALRWLPHLPISICDWRSEPRMLR